MVFLRRCSRSLIPFLIIAFVNLSMPVHPVSAAMVGTDAVIDSVKVKADRARVLAFLERKDVSTQMQSFGISEAEAKSRVDILSDSEVVHVAGTLDQLPAGGDSGAIIGALLLVFIVLLFTDILGLTHVFPAISGKR